MGFRTIAGLVASVAILSFLITTYYSMKNEILTLNSENTALKLELVQTQQNTDKLKEAIANSNKAIEELKATNNKLTEDYNKWKNKPVEVKYKDRVVKEVVTVYKDGNVSQDCKKALELLNKISNIKYKDL